MIFLPSHSQTPESTNSTPVLTLFLTQAQKKPVFEKEVKMIESKGNQVKGCF